MVGVYFERKLVTEKLHDLQKYMAKYAVFCAVILYYIVFYFLFA